MVNCNPETVSTDYDTSDRLYFEPLTDEDVANVLDAEQAASAGEGRLVGVIVSLGGQTPLKLAGRAPAGPGPRHPARVDRPRRGPRAVERAVRAARHPPARRRDRAHRATEALGGRPVGRLPGARPPVATCSAGGPWRSSTTTTASLEARRGR